MRRTRNAVGEQSPRRFESSTLRPNELLNESNEMNVPNEFFILGGFLIVGFLALGWHAFRLHRKINVLFGGAEETHGQCDLAQNIVYRMTRIEAMHEEAGPRLERLEKLNKTNIQKMGFVRFNPFQDTGGDNSFVLTLLDEENSGVLISSLYTRDGTRIYGKRIERGRTRYPMLEEEKQVLEETVSK